MAHSNPPCIFQVEFFLETDKKSNLNHSWILFFKIIRQGCHYPLSVYYIKLDIYMHQDVKNLK